ncbi:mediator of RNA polymerase II transcription subunit 20 [Biomphalaria glabrata]|uniref:Mediator of RNA polymerase II transcription subunit 20 n=2 Tax=Biomphalaria TaxID=6525 RepID=A0A9W3A6H6_BIOGL|nr:mediator of RNA polymerase II transcription subunit 20-like [Biomphalaria glabrata]KAI8739594.1 mediator of RNA polymerase II transcription subunit 20-like [Biomphalaria glabrata]KAI8771856.1 mediator of RNA polymerase II transcription subunit 20 [Biomphalaria glabrata]KAK0040334.1 mediator of RNA polymerase II transcription subunit 20 [Biomphalaria pfeifferi]
MGVSCVYMYPVPEGRSGAHVVEVLQKQVETIGGVKMGSFVVDCESYLSIMLSVSKTLQILHNTEYPASCFAVLDSGATLVADTLFNGLLSHLKAYYQARKGSKIESKGNRYQLADFVIKIGSVTLSGSFKGILVEVEYCPSVIASECWNLMKELLQSLIGNIAESPPPSLKMKMDEIYTPAMTMLQYLEHFNNFRKAAAVSQPPR